LPNAACPSGARELGFDANALAVALARYAPTTPPLSGDEQGGWGAWLGKEEQFYVKTAELVRGLSWEEIVDLGGIDLRACCRKVQQAYATHMRVELPETLHAAPVATMELGLGQSVVSGYNLNDMLVIPAALARALNYFDGRCATADVVRTIRSETGEAVDSGVLMRLIDFKVLVPLPDLATTDLGTSLREAQLG
jgi:hypothetical protein